MKITATNGKGNILVRFFSSIIKKDIDLLPAFFIGILLGIAFFHFEYLYVLGIFIASAIVIIVFLPITESRSLRAEFWKRGSKIIFISYMTAHIFVLIPLNKIHKNEKIPIAIKYVQTTYGNNVRCDTDVQIIDVRTNDVILKKHYPQLSMEVTTPLFKDRHFII